jgi:hypothetical protein
VGGPVAHLPGPDIHPIPQIPLLQMPMKMKMPLRQATRQQQQQQWQRRMTQTNHQGRIPLQDSRKTHMCFSKPTVTSGGLPSKSFTDFAMSFLQVRGAQ